MRKKQIDNLVKVSLGLTIKKNPNFYKIILYQVNDEIYTYCHKLGQRRNLKVCKVCKLKNCPFKKGIDVKKLEKDGILLVKECTTDNVKRLFVEE